MQHLRYGISLEGSTELWFEKNTENKTGTEGRNTSEVNFKT